jgi:hypothetical protein
LTLPLNRPLPAKHTKKDFLESGGVPKRVREGQAKTGPRAF